MLESSYFLFAENSSRSQFIEQLALQKAPEGKGYGDIQLLEELHPPHRFDFLLLESTQVSSLEPDLLIVEDEWAYTKELLQAAAQVEEIQRIIVCSDYETIERLLQLKGTNAPPAVVTLDFKLGWTEELLEGRTLRLYKLLRQKLPNSSVIGITNFESKEHAVNLIQQMHADGYNVFDKSLTRSGDLLANILRNEIGIQRSKLQTSDNNPEKLKLSRYDQAKANRVFEVLGLDFARYQEDPRFAHLPMPYIGGSPQSKLIKSLIIRYADSSLPVLIRGPRGTGKEVIANAIHNLGPNRHRKMITVNCASIVPELFESELFGIKAKVASDVAERKGYFEQAKGGTLFLDEVAEIPLRFQAKLLRAIASPYEVVPVGAVFTRDVIQLTDVRVIFATNANLEEMVLSHRFRADLYDRLSAGAYFPEILPLHHRPEDIEVLIDYFLAKMGGDSLSPKARNLLLDYSWPGNVRELKSVIGRAVEFNRHQNQRPISEDLIDFFLPITPVPYPAPQSVLLSQNPESPRRNKHRKAAKLLDAIEIALVRLQPRQMVNREILAAEMHTIEKGQKGYAPTTLSTLVSDLRPELKELLYKEQNAFNWPLSRQFYGPIKRLITHH
ncbi:MAG: sigma 54-interacting transcriptional regulator [Bacteroidota bacterium]